LPALVVRGKERLSPFDTVAPEFPDMPGWLNTLLKDWGRLEILWMALLGLPMGLSVAGVLRKDQA
jgi:hypothetical protein